MVPWSVLISPARAFESGSCAVKLNFICKGAKIVILFHPSPLLELSATKAEKHLNIYNLFQPLQSITTFSTLATYFNKN